MIDDDADFRSGAVRYLAEFGFRAITATPMEALDAAKREKPRLILLDLCLDGRAVYLQPFLETFDLKLNHGFGAVPA